MHVFANQLEALGYYNHRLPAVKACIEADKERALAPGDFVRAGRYAGRLALLEYKSWVYAPAVVSCFTSFD